MIRTKNIGFTVIFISCFGFFYLYKKFQIYCFFYLKIIRNYLMLLIYCCIFLNWLPKIFFNFLHLCFFFFLLCLLPVYCSFLSFVFPYHFIILYKKNYICHKLVESACHDKYHAE